MKIREVEQGIIGEGMVGRNVRSFISIVGFETYFGFKEVMTGKVIEFEKVMNFKKAISRVINHTNCLLQGGFENGKDNAAGRQWKGIYSR